MKVAIVGSRNLTNVDISEFIPAGTREIVSGGAAEIDTLAEKWADKNRISKTVIRPEYSKYGRSAPLVRNKEIVQRADVVVAIWDGKSRGTKYTIEYARQAGKQVKVHILEE